MGDPIEFLQNLNLQFVEFVGSLVGGPEIALIILFTFAKISAVLGTVLGVIPFIIYAERKLIGFIQDRPGPNRVGPFGLLQGIVDGAKLLMKEDFIPAGADRTLYLLAPPIVLIPAFAAMCIIPFGPVIEGEALLHLYMILGIESLWSPDATLALAISNPNIGILYLFAITSVGVYGITLAGWSSENKWSLLGGIRASAQMISYEISLSLSIIGVLLIAGSLNLYDIIAGQEGPLWILHWNIFAQPVGFLLFFIAIFAETNRLPFDLAEGEAELTGGFHTEYSSMKFALFFLAEYANMITASAIAAVLFFGGYLLIPMDTAVWAIDSVLAFLSEQAGFQYLSGVPYIIAALLAPFGLFLKVAAFLFIFIMARGVLPRLRYDQVMNLGWKIMLVAGLINLVVTAFGVVLLAGWAMRGVPEGASAAAISAAVAETLNNYKWIIGLVTLAMLIAADRIYAAGRRKRLQATYRNFAVRKPGPPPKPAAVS